MNLPALRGLIVSVQPEKDSVLAMPSIVAELAACAFANGATGVRIESAAHIAAVRKRCGEVPLIGLLKRSASPQTPYITATMPEVEHVLDAGASIVALDATARPRPDGSTFADAVKAVHAAGALAFADCAEVEDARAALQAGADVVGTTLCGYTSATQSIVLPALELVARIKALGAPFTVCEGGIATPQQARAAFAAGADAVVVGTAITNIDLNVRRFVEAIR